MRRVALVIAGALIGCGTLATSLAWAGRRPSDAERGRELWERHCMACHGTHARGDGPATAQLVAEVPSAEGVVTRDNVDDFVDVVLRGKGAMPGYEASFDRYDARRVLRTMGSLASRPVGATPEPDVAEPEDENGDEEEEAGDEAPTVGEPARPVLKRPTLPPPPLKTPEDG